MSAIRALSFAIMCLLWATATWAVQPHFRLGIVNERPEKPDHALSQYESMHAYLQRRLSRKRVSVGDLVVTQNISDMTNRVLAHRVDAVIEGLMPTLTIERDSQLLAPALLPWRKGQRQYHSVFFVRKGSAIRELRDLNGRTIAFETPRSTSAYYIPSVTLQSLGLRLATKPHQNDDAGAIRYAFAGSELNQGYWVKEGRADAGAFNDGDWLRLPDHLRQQLRIIHTTKPVLRWLLSFHVKLDPETRGKVTEILLHMHEDMEGRAALQEASRIAKFEALTASDESTLGHWRNVLRGIE